MGDTTSLVPGFPIRTSSDLSSVDSSPRLIAASYVLHRLLVPRHPPYALTHLLTKMLASTVQFSNNTPASNRFPRPDRNSSAVSRRSERIVFCLERTSVLSGPNSESITSEHCSAHVSVPPMSVRGPTFEDSNGLCQRNFNLCEALWRCAP